MTPIDGQMISVDYYSPVQSVDPGQPLFTRVLKVSLKVFDRKSAALKQAQFDLFLCEHPGRNHFYPFDVPAEVATKIPLVARRIGPDR